MARAVQRHPVRARGPPGREGFVDDAIHICTRDGRDRHFLVASTAVRDDYGAEFSEAVADAVATSVRRAAGLA